MPNLIAANNDINNPWSRTERAHEQRLAAVLAMGPMEFKAWCWTNSVGQFAPATSFAPQADMTGESL